MFRSKYGMGKYRLYLCTVDEEESEPLPGEQLPSRKSRRGFSPRRRLPLLATFSCLGVIPPVASEKKTMSGFLCSNYCRITSRDTLTSSLYCAFSGHIHCGYAVLICSPTGVAFAVLDDVVCFGFFLQIGYQR